MSGKSRAELIRELRDPEFRAAYVKSTLANVRAFQIDALRAKREWNQSKLGIRAKKPQSEISRLENPDYTNCTVKTLADIAAAFDVALIVKFVSFCRFLQEFEDVSPAALDAKTFNEEFTKTTAIATATIVSSTNKDLLTDTASTAPITTNRVGMDAHI